MSESPGGTTTSVSIFISYRRTGTSWVARSLYADLARTFGNDHVFMDVETISPGSRWSPLVKQAAAACTIMLVIIGPGWSEARDESGRRRLDNHEDVMRREIELAAQNGVQIVPVLVDGATMPRQEDLPTKELRQLLEHQVVDVRHASYESDVNELIRQIRPNVPFQLARGGYHYHPNQGGFYVQMSIDGSTIFLTRTPSGENLWRPVRTFELDKWTIPRDSNGRPLPVEIMPVGGYNTVLCRWR